MIFKMCTFLSWVIKVFLVCLFVLTQVSGNTSSVLYTSEVKPPKSSNILNYDGKTYFFSTSIKANFYAAHHFCRQQGMQLLTINSEAENHKISEFATNIGHGVETFWTSGTDLAKPKFFIWLSNGSPFTYQRWSNLEPTGLSGDGYRHIENCVELQRDSKLNDFTWNDRYCLDEMNFICEKYNTIC
ncbi:C-type lectin mosGCTL-7-like [Diabrotica undecimpunctata]|uniref:C-type lectin mosGCTL-7-like n=1 Tax=Diabrotica undecimpunctata TaxID=50387 RepID=UPI003B640696